MKTLVLELKKTEADDGIKHDAFYLNTKAKIILNESDIDDVFESI